MGAPYLDFEIQYFACCQNIRNPAIVLWIDKLALRKHKKENRMFHLIWVIVIGFVVGVIAKFLMPGKDPAGFIITVIIGIAGSFLGTYLGRAIGHYGPDQSAGFLMSLVGAIILLAIYHLFTRRKAG